MKRLACHFLLIQLLLSGVVNAQFRGGASDGHATVLATNLALGHNIYLGGTDDGHALATASNLSLGRNIYVGGADDGHALSTASNLNLGRNIYLGGADDGHASLLASNLNLGRNIYTGGADDGHSLATASNLNLGRNIFTGGANDGWAMALATEQTLSALPVTLVSFTGQWNNNDGLLQWQTATEQHTARFELERSFDANAYQAIGSVQAAGQSSSPRSYRHTDSAIRQRLPQGVVYYRLRTVDVDGSAVYSAIVILRTDAARLVQYSLFPNPARNQVTVMASTLDRPTAIRLTDVSGRLVLQQTMTSQRQQLDVSSLPAGTYFLRLEAAGDLLYTQKLLITK